MMHLAMHDALNAIVPVYETYAFRGSARRRRIRSLRRHRPHTTCSSLSIPAQLATLARSTRPMAGDTFRLAMLRERGIVLGRAAAAAVLAQRRW